MLNRLTISTLLKVAIALCGVAVIALLSFSVSDSWSRMSAASRIASAMQASADLFTALHNLRVDRANTYRDLLGANPNTQLMPMLRDARAGEMPALHSAVETLQVLDVPGQRELVAQLSDSVAKLDATHKASDAAVAQPKASRPAGIADQWMKQTNRSVGSDRQIVEGSDGVDQAAGFLYRPAHGAEGSRLGLRVMRPANLRSSSPTRCRARRCRQRRGTITSPMSARSLRHGLRLKT